MSSSTPVTREEYEVEVYRLRLIIDILTEALRGQHEKILRGDYDSARRCDERVAEDVERLSSALALAREGSVEALERGLPIDQSAISRIMQDLPRPPRKT